jgi:membrane-bound lytic murein transglycosylase MltF
VLYFRFIKSVFFLLFVFLLCFVVFTSVDTYKFTANAAVSMTPGKQTSRHGDLSVMIERQSLRVLVAFDNVGFFMNKGTQDGLYVALMNSFKNFLEKKYPNSKNLKIYFIPVPQENMPKLISEGVGDIAVGLSPTEDGKRFVDFSIPEKLWLKEIAVLPKDAKPIKKLEDFSGRFFWVRENSSYYESLKNLNMHLKAMKLKPVIILKAEEYLSDADLVDMVSKGEIVGTIIDNSRLLVWRRYFKNVNFIDKVPLKVNSVLSWAMRHESKELFREVNMFLRQYRDGTALGKPIYDKYLRTSPSLNERMDRKSAEWLGISAEDFTKYAKIFMKYGNIFDIDWMLLMAQGYQESTLNPQARSNRGAVGIMQVLPSTANEWYININSVHEIDNNVHAGVKYMRYIMDNYLDDEKMTKSEKILFALASYNCGPSRIKKYQKEAVTKGLNPNKWFENVEKIAMEHKAVETVKYVRNISSLYISYQNAYNLQQQKDQMRTTIENLNPKNK